MTTLSSPVRALLLSLALVSAPLGTAAAAADSAAPTLDELRNATYRGLEGAPPEVTLRDGRWEGEPWQPGAATRPRVSLLGELLLAGDLDGDGADEAVVLLDSVPGGTGRFLHLAVMARQAGQLSNIATAMVGDRVQVRAARIENQRIVLDVVQAGPGDAACCPGELASYSWKLVTTGALERAVPVLQGRLSLAALEGREWVLRAWRHDEPAPAQPEVTLQLRDGKLGGHSGCNRYFASVQEGGAPGDISLGPVGATRMACPDAEAAVEERFLRQLGSVGKFGFVLGRLALTYRTDGGVAAMLFEPRAAGDANR